MKPKRIEPKEKRIERERERKIKVEVKVKEEGCVRLGEPP